MNPKEQGVRYTEIEHERADKNRLSPNAIRQRPEQRNQKVKQTRTIDWAVKASLSGKCSCVVAKVGMYNKIT